jgi:hypothetical protein
MYGGDPYAISVSGSTLFLGGDFGEVGGKVRSNIAAVSTDGTLTDWATLP